MSLITELENSKKKNQTVQYRPGDQVKVHFKIVEGDNERTQVFEGTVIRRRGTGLGKTFTVRKVSFGIGVERIFPIDSPKIEKIELVKRGKVRHSKLYYLRDLSGKAARIEELESKQDRKST